MGQQIYVPCLPRLLVLDLLFAELGHLVAALLQIVANGLGFQTEHADNLKGLYTQIDIQRRVLSLRGFLGGFCIQRSEMLENVVAGYTRSV